MTSPDPEAPADRPEASDPAPEPSQRDVVRKALLPYRILAWTTGVWLIALCYEMVMKYGYGVENLSWIGVVHGWVYFVYLLATANLAVKVRWPIAKTVGVLLAGTIPLLGIIVEHFQTKQVKAAFGL
jgi:integral membrane protein